MLQGDQYRRHRQFLRFAGASTISLVFARWTHKALFKLKYKPGTFQSNIRMPISNIDTLGSQAMTLSTGLSSGVFSMIVFGTCWIADIDTIDEFSQGLKNLFKPLNQKNRIQHEEAISQEDEQNLSELWESFKK